VRIRISLAAGFLGDRPCQFFLRVGPDVISLVQSFQGPGLGQPSDPAIQSIATQMSAQTVPTTSTTKK
jgi:hypothetical protein